MTLPLVAGFINTGTKEGRPRSCPAKRMHCLQIRIQKQNELPRAASSLIIFFLWIQQKSTTLSWTTTQQSGGAAAGMARRSTGEHVQ